MIKARCLLLFIAGLLLTGCIGSAGPAPEDRYYRIPVVKPASRPAPLLQGVTAIEPLRAAGLYHDRAIVYVDEDKPLRLQSYHYHHWLETPARMLQAYMLDWLRQARFSPRVARHAVMPGAERVIFGYIRRFDRLVGKRMRVMVELELGLRDRNHRLLFWPRVYRAVVPVSGPGLARSAAAFGKAIARVLRDFVRDVERSR